MPKPPAPAATTSASQNLDYEYSSTNEDTPEPAQTQDYVRALIGFTFFPGRNDVNISASGKLAGRTLTTTIDPLRLLQHDYTGAGFVDVYGQNSGLRFGEGDTDAFGNAEGIRLYHTPSRQGLSYGLSLYRRITETNPFEGVPAADADWQANRYWNFGALVAADTSWRLTQEFQGRRGQVTTFGGHDAQNSRFEGGVQVAVQPDPSASLYGRYENYSGDQGGYTWAYGASHAIGPAYLGFDDESLREQGELNREIGTSLILPIRRDSLLLRWQRGSIEPSGTLPSISQNSSLVFAAFNAEGRGGLSLTASTGATWQSGNPTQTFVLFGFSRPLAGIWSIQGTIDQNLRSGAPEAQFGLACRIDRNWSVTFLCGPSPVSDAAGRTHQAFGIALARVVDVSFKKAGTVRVVAILAGKPYAGLRVRLDREHDLATNKAGTCTVRNVVPGRHTVRLDLASLPADLDSDETVRIVVVEAGKTATAQFTFRKVGQITGSVQVMPDALGRFDPTAGSDVVISAGDARVTTTDENGNFVLGGLPEGSYTVTLVPATIPQDFQVIGPQTANVTVEPDSPAPTVHFTIGPKQKIEFAGPDKP